jgi:hypothetical protein
MQLGDCFQTSSNSNADERPCSCQSWASAVRPGREMFSTNSGAPWNDLPDTADDVTLEDLQESMAPKVFKILASIQRTQISQALDSLTKA